MVRTYRISTLWIWLSILLTGFYFTQKQLLSYFQNLSPSEDKLSSLGSYLLISLAFVFFEMLEFALVLLLKEYKLDETTHDKNKSKSVILFSRQKMELQKTVGKVSPSEEKSHDLDINDVAESRQTTFRINRPRFFQKLPLTRKVDFLAFVIYHFAYFLFNLVYWVWFK